jgi:hypothetical protein
VPSALLIFFARVLSAAQPACPLKISLNHRYLVDQNNLPILVQGDAAWSLITGLTDDEAEAYLENRRQKGFNSIIVNLIERKFRGPLNRDLEGPS